MAEPRKTQETPKTAANKSSAMRWALAVAAIFIIGVIAWWVSGLPRGESPVLDMQSQPQNQSGYEEGSDATQPPAVIPNQDPDGSPLPTPEPAGPGTQ